MFSHFECSNTTLCLHTNYAAVSYDVTFSLVFKLFFFINLHPRN